VLARFTALPASQLVAAAGLTAASYLLLTGYDFLALLYVGRELRFRDVLYISFTSFAFSNSIGFQLLSGGSMRYRIYSRLGLKAIEIGEIVAFCTFTYALGVVTVGGAIAAFNPASLTSLLPLPEWLISAIGLCLLAVSAAYAAGAAIWRKPIAFGPYRLRPPSPALALAQIALASIDATLAGAVMYALLPAESGMPFWSFLGVYIVATNDIPQKPTRARRNGRRRTKWWPPLDPQPDYLALNRLRSPEKRVLVHGRQSPAIQDEESPL
jgi:uncharacterized membrane protein YbhN (UPF0104 family)